MLAAKPSLAYQFAKFAKRHTAAVLGAALVLISLLAGIAATWREARIAESQRARAERRFQDVRKLANSLLFELHDAIRDLPGSTPARELPVSRALETPDTLSAESADPGLRRELASAYEKVGDVQGGYHSASLGNVPGAIASYRKALAIRSALERAEQADDALRRDLVRNHGKLSDVLLVSGNTDEALEHSRELLAMPQRLADRNPGSLVDEGQLASAYLDVGWKKAGHGDWQTGIANLRKATALCERMVAAHPQDPVLERRLAIAYDRTGTLIAGYTTGVREALTIHQKGLALATSLSARQPLNTDLRRILAYAHVGIGTDLLSAGDGSARPHFAAALKEFEPLAQADPKNVQYRLDIAHTLGLDAVAAIGTERPAEAVRLLERALALLHDLPTSLDSTTFTAWDQFRMGKAYLKMGMVPKAHSWFERSLPGLEVARQRGGLHGRDARLPDEARSEIARMAQRTGDSSLPPES